jgi:hypothetical protein
MNPHPAPASPAKSPCQGLLSPKLDGPTRTITIRSQPYKLSYPFFPQVVSPIVVVRSPGVPAAAWARHRSENGSTRLWWQASPTPSRWRRPATRESHDGRTFASNCWFQRKMARNARFALPAPVAPTLTVLFPGPWLAEEKVHKARRRGVRQIPERGSVHGKCKCAHGRSEILSACTFGFPATSPVGRRVR